LERAEAYPMQTISYDPADYLVPLDEQPDPIRLLVESCDVPAEQEALPFASAPDAS
jgi:hypothetical protein